MIVAVMQSLLPPHHGPVSKMKASSAIADSTSRSFSKPYIPKRPHKAIDLDPKPSQDLGFRAYPRVPPLPRFVDYVLEKTDPAVMSAMVNTAGPWPEQRGISVV